jgi:hypothetical protein
MALALALALVLQWLPAQVNLPLAQQRQAKQVEVL